MVTETELPKKLSKKKRSLVKYIIQNYILYLFLAPAIILTIIFKYVPMYGAIIAFKNFSPMKGIWGSDWVGFEHFKDFLTSPNLQSGYDRFYK